MSVASRRGKFTGASCSFPYSGGGEDTIRSFFVSVVHEFLFEPGLDSLMVMSDFVIGNDISPKFDQDMGSVFSRATVKIVDSMPGVRDDDPQMGPGVSGRKTLIDFYTKRLATLRQRGEKG